MAINLQKGQTINLRKDECDLSKVTIGLGWHVKEAKKGFLGSVFGAKEADYDLDAIAFLMDDQDKVRNLGNKLVGGDVVFFNNKKHPSGTVWSSGDNLVGGTGDADCEQIVCLLTKVPEQYGVQGIPALFLLDPEGKILKSGLRGDAILPAVKEAVK